MEEEVITENPSENRAAVETFKVRGNSSKQLELYGAVMQKSQQTVQTTRAGRLTELSCQVGDEVRAGDMI